MESIALVSMNGSIDFFCYPDFDSPTVFAALLDDQRGGRFEIRPQIGEMRVRQLYFPDTNILLTRFLSEEGVAELTDYMPVQKNAGQANQIVRILSVISGNVKFKMSCQPRFNYAASDHAWDAIPLTPELEHEGVLRSEVLIESKTPAQFLTEELKMLAQQFLQQIFINSGGARYLPRISAETALVEDFAESEAADAPSKLLDALRLSHRRGLARSEIDNALIRFGSQVLAEQLHLDPIEYRLVCIPYDLYVRLGRDRNWGQWHHWTHFDGYQVVRDNRLSALVGGDGRFGGINDLVSISRTDAREGVYVRFAVVRRARMVARWR